MPTYYISPTGNDTTGDGSSGNPWQTITKALTGSSSGDTIICKNGTYTQAANYSFSTGGRTIQAENTGLAIFDGAATYHWFLGGDVNMTGLVFQNYTLSSFYSAIGYTNSPNNAGTLTMTNCTFKNSVVRGGTSPYGGLIGSFSPTGNPVYNLINCQIYGISTASSSSTGYIFKSSGSINTINLTNASVVATVTGATGVNGIFFNQTASKDTITVTNSIISNESGNTVTMANVAPVSQTNLKSCFYTLTAGSGSLSGTGVITSDPLFVDAPNGNFNLRPTSPCRWVGT